MRWAIGCNGCLMSSASGPIGDAQTDRDPRLNWIGKVQKMSNLQAACLLALLLICRTFVDRRQRVTCVLAEHQTSPRWIERQTGDRAVRLTGDPNAGCITSGNTTGRPARW